MPARVKGTGTWLRTEAGDAVCECKHSFTEHNDALGDTAADCMAVGAACPCTMFVPVEVPPPAGPAES